MSAFEEPSYRRIRCIECQGLNSRECSLPWDIPENYTEEVTFGFAIRGKVWVLQVEKKENCYSKQREHTLISMKNHNEFIKLVAKMGG